MTPVYARIGRQLIDSLRHDSIVGDARPPGPAFGMLRGIARRVRAPGPPDDAPANIDWTRFPLRALAKRGWIPNVPDPAAHAEELVRGLIARAGGGRAVPAALYRRTDSLRANAKTDPYALRAWCWQALATAAETRVRDRPTPMAVLDLAQALRVHPAVVAGRVRYETGNYRLLSQFVGTGEVRRQFRE